MKVGYIILSSAFAIMAMVALGLGERVFGGLMIIASQLILILDTLEETSEKIDKLMTLVAKRRWKNECKRNV